MNGWPFSLVVAAGFQNGGYYRGHPGAVMPHIGKPHKILR